MNLNTIKNKITFIFIITFILLLIIFVFYLGFQKKEHNSAIINKYQTYSKYLSQKRAKRTEAIQYLNENNLALAKSVQKVLTQGKVLFSNRMFEVIEIKETYYFHLTTPGFRVLFVDKNIHKQNRNYTFVFFVLFFTILFFIYLWLLKSLKPLNDLKDKIKQISEGNLNISFKSEKNDEVAQVSNEFDKAIKKIDLLLNSRQLFLRTIMHELKTPLAKAKIVTELLDDNKQKDRLINIHNKMNFLINDFAQIEEILSDNYSINKQKNSFDFLLKESKELLLNTQASNIKLEINSELNINCDVKLFIMVIKNLIDNALKYSLDKQILIKQENNSLLFISKGDKLPKDIKEYFKPFHNDTQDKNHGMGLGLYIINSIVLMHEFTFEYKYENENNIFLISFI